MSSLCIQYLGSKKRFKWPQIIRKPLSHFQFKKVDCLYYAATQVVCQTHLNLPNCLCMRHYLIVIHLNLLTLSLYCPASVLQYMLTTWCGSEALSLILLTLLTLSLYCPASLLYAYLMVYCTYEALHLIQLNLLTLSLYCLASLLVVNYMLTSLC